ncbi:MAG TPA: glycosyltransferase [Candidatus Dormibacteraeota bacterium]|nr:glycosyltransferase [Candidatus Dormibacteraeota bacterium]
MKPSSKLRGGASSVVTAPAVSVIIPLHRDNSAFRKCLDGCSRLDYRPFEVIVVSDEKVDLPAGARLLLTGADHDTGPGEKRDVGMHAATGEFLAFIDDDAVPRADWLAKAVEIFADESIAAVAGPGVTPPGSAWPERAGGAFYESWLGSGPYRYRFKPGRRRDVDDYPAYNLIVRRSAAEHVKGWGTGFYGGEDTVICLALVEAGWRIVYDPEVVVFHRRRPVMRKHLAQVGNVGMHRGYFVKAYPRTSLRPSYFLPTAGTAALAGLTAAALFSGRARGLLVAGLGAYAGAAVLLGLLERDEPSVAAALPAVALASHVTYGIQFVRGLLTPRLAR